MRLLGADPDLGFAALVGTMVFNQSRGLTALGIPVTGLSWSAGVWAANAAVIEATGVGPIQSFILVALGGLSQTLAIWIGFAAVAWAMVRALSSKVALLQLLVLTSRSAVPLWFGAFAAALAFNGSDQVNLLLVSIALIGLAGFLVLASSALAQVLEWTIARAGLALGATVVFLVSFVSLMA